MFMFIFRFIKIIKIQVTKNKYKIVIKIQNTHCKKQITRQNAKYRIQNTKYKLQITKYKTQITQIQHAYYKLQITIYKIQNAKCKMEQNAKCKIHLIIQNIVQLPSKKINYNKTKK